MPDDSRDAEDSAGKTTDIAEGLAIAASLLCLAHCLILPVLLASSPAVSRALDLPFDLHLWIVLIAGPVSLWLLVSAARQQRIFVMAAGLAGLGMLVLALVLPVTETGEIAISSMGSVSLAFAHVSNWLTRHPRAYLDA
ncbi:MerC mercury resistance protein [Blastomonas natatoria]|uniref:MerC mercury resistance protein n=1 Tax=Blastomonas natatoria TaxID=34015 RepID=A0A2V3VCE4_9SPHN|nr:MerC domain-containing protein [Blastomonas natatoria]PXW79387.1 MerC mercury resistance protein [Blastomonas natatoria]